MIGIGVTPTGWPALLTMVRGLTRDGAVGYVVVHRDGETPDAARVAEVQAATELEVVLASDGDLVQPDMIHVVPAGRDVELEDRRLRLDGPEAHRPFPIDRFLRSLGRSLQRDAVGVVLGTELVGVDGELGLERIKEYGGLTVAAVPDAALPDPGLIDLVVRPEVVSRRIREIPADDPDPRALVGVGPGVVGDPIVNALREILHVVRARTGHDFAHYKRATLMRRIARRMQVAQTETLDAYHAYVLDQPGEAGFLLRDFLISVTNFFRDPDAFATLEHVILPKLFANRDQGGQIRLWSAGCATGEEAYSLAILALEHASRLEDPPEIQVFATDIDEAALAEARAGCYPAGIVGDLSPERLQRWFTRDGTHYRVKTELREKVLFSPHNLLRDPPFSKLDLVACRNLLIYLEREAQDRVLSIIHFALRPDGYLMLGSSESIDAAALQFAPIDARQRLFIRRPAATTVPISSLFANRWPPTPPPVMSGAGDRASLSFGELHHRIVELYAPPSILVNEELDIVHVSQHAGRYLTLSGGEPTRDLLRLIHPDLRLDLRAAIYAARQPGRTADVRTVQLPLEGVTREIRIGVRTLQEPDVARGMVLVTFAEQDLPQVALPPPDPSRVEPVVHQLESELMETRNQLRSTIEQYETSAVELRASNEELHAMNEELRSATEELETSKEELQSVNEELTTMNHELKDKVDEVSRAHGDLQNLMTSTDIAVVFLDPHLHIQRFTPRALDLFNLIPTDVGRPLAHVTHRLELEDLPAEARAVVKSERGVERRVRTADGQRYLMRVRPYRSVHGRNDGVVLTFLDITEIERAEEALRASEERFRLALRSAPVVIVTQDRDLRYEWGHMQGADIDFVGKRDEELFPAAEAAVLTELKRGVLETGTSRRAQVTLTRAGATRHYDYTVEAARQDGAIVGVCSAAVDITPSVVAAEALRDADRRKDEFIATLAHELRNPLAPIRAALDLQAMARDDLGKIHRARDRMDRQIGQLIHLVDDLLDVSRISVGSIELRREQVTVGAIVAAALEATSRQVSGGGHTVIVRQPDELSVAADPTRLTQILTNLIANAARYTATPSTIEVAVTVEVDGFQIAVRDQGMGIAAADLTAIFDKFHRTAVARERKPGGLGIGLHLVRSLVELHGGTIEARSDGVDLGAEMIVRMPIGEPPATRAAPASRQPVARRRDVLVVDDNREVAESLADVIAMLGHEVRLAHDGAAALAAVEARRPDVVFLDLGLPDMEGYEVARQLRARPGGAEMQVVVLSGWGGADDVERTRAAGVDLHLVKPAALDQIRAIVGDAA